MTDVDTDGLLRVIGKQQVQIEVLMNQLKNVSEAYQAQEKLLQSLAPQETAPEPEPEAEQEKKS